MITLFASRLFNCFLRVRGLDNTRIIVLPNKLSFKRTEYLIKATVKMPNNVTDLTLRPTRSLKKKITFDIIQYG
jgi:hypothetical protein